MQHLKVSLSIIILIVVFIYSKPTSAQRVGINGNGAVANASAALDVDVSAMAGAKRGLLIPRVTEAERLAMNPLPEAAQGLMVYQTDGQAGFYYNTSGSAIPNWTAVVSNQSLRWNVLQSATGNLFLDNAANTTAFTFNGLNTGNAFSLSTNTITSGNLLNLFSNSNAGTAATSSKMLNINRIGANSNNGHISTGINVSVGTTGPGSINYGGYFLSGGGTTNYGVYAKAQSGIATAVAAENTSTVDDDQYGLYATKSGNTGGGIGYAVSGRASGTGSQNYGGNFYATAANNNFGIYARVVGVGTAVFARTESSGIGIGFGVRSEITGPAPVNYAGYFSAKDATNNYALFVPANGGRVSLGSSSSDMNAMLSISNGHFQTQQTLPPTIVAYSNAGILSNVFFGAGSTDVGGSFTIISGGGTTVPGEQALITFNKPFSKSAKVIITPSSINAAGRPFFVESSTTNFFIYFLQAPVPNSVYSYNYIVIDN